VVAGVIKGMLKELGGCLFQTALLAIAKESLPIRKGMSDGVQEAIFTHLLTNTLMSRYATGWRYYYP
jgi:ABC-type antimicrobial peptide transport system permease subunit